MNTPTLSLKQRLLGADLRLCSFANRGCDLRLVRWYFAVFSRLGDGLLWYCLMLLLPVIDGWYGAAVSLQMALAGLLGVLIYRQLKQRTARPRPYQVHAHIRHGARALDPGSFPSGHTLHAVCFTLLLVQAYPSLWLVLLPVCLSIALSRLVLGLHYPSDVISGAALGWLLAQLAVWMQDLAFAAGVIDRGWIG